MVLSIHRGSSLLNTKSSGMLFVFWGELEVGDVDHFRRKTFYLLHRTDRYFCKCSCFCSALVVCPVMLYFHTGVQHQLISNETSNKNLILHSAASWLMLFQHVIELSSASAEIQTER